MSITGLSHVNLRADRQLLEELKRFYTDVVGLVPGARPPFAQFGYWLYAGTHDVLHLSEASAGDVRARAIVSTIDHVAFACTDIAAATARLEEHQVPYQCDAVPRTVERQLFFRDPAGNRVELNGPGPGAHTI